MRLTRAAGLFSPVALVTLVTYATPAAAQGTDVDRQIAQQLFDDGRALMADHRYGEACPKFGESQRLDPGGGTLLNLALCHELEGKTATASSELRDALGQAVRDGRKDRQDIAEAHIDALAPRLSRVIIDVPPRLAARDPVIQLDTSRLPVAAWNTAIPVDPGEHRITVTSPSWSTTVRVTEPGATYTVTLPTPPPGNDPLPPPPIGPERSVSPERPVGTSRSPAFWPLLGGGAALGVASVVTGIVALSASAYVSDNCSAARDFCRVDDAGEAATRAKTFAWVSTVTLAAGVAAVITAFVLPGPARAPSGSAKR